MTESPDAFSIIARGLEEAYDSVKRVREALQEPRRIRRDDVVSELKIIEKAALAVRDRALRTYDLPKVEGRYALLKVGKLYESRTVLFAIERALRGEPLNGEQKVSLINILAQLRLHEKAKWDGPRA